MKAHHALGAFSFVGMLVLVYGTWMLCAMWGWPAAGQIGALLISGTWVWSIMDADKSLLADTHRENRAIGTAMKDLSAREHDFHAEAVKPQPWHQ